MDIKLMAALLDNAYREWNELEVEFYRQQKANFIVDAQVTSRRKKAAKALVKYANQYSSLLGEPFDWPREAVEHARANFVDAAQGA
jgi:hypothetical protein